MTLWTFGTGDGAHALVVGVGRYPALAGGGGLLYPSHGGMGQLSSPAPSAIAVANWLTTKYQSTDAPLRSLELLVSDGVAVEFEAAGTKQSVGSATFAAFKQAVLAWFGRLDTSDQNRAIFFFCGHGVSAGYQSTLLLEDYGMIPAAALASALDFTVFHRAMDQCRAREQLFVVDACRVASPSLINAGGYNGDPILQPGLPTSPPRKSPVFFAALPGTLAYGRDKAEPSLFTAALLRALRGAGAGKVGASWAILPSVLYRSLMRLLEDAIVGTGVAQACTVNELADFALHELVGRPDVPVVVDCRSPIDVNGAFLRASSAATVRLHPPPVPNPWCVDLPFGQYRFSATSPNGKTFDCDEIVFPPYTDVELP